MKLLLPETFNNPATYITGHDYMEAPFNEARKQTWNYFERYRLTSFADTVGRVDASQSATSRHYEQNWKDKDEIYPEGYFNQLTGEKEESSGDTITADEANEKYGMDGRLTFDGDVSIAEAQLLHDRKIEEMKYQDVYNRAHGFWKNAGMFSVGMASALWDPANIGAMFIPVGGQAAFLANVARTGLHAARFRRGFKQGAIWSTAFEIPTAAQLFNEQADYSLWYSTMNVAFGGVFGGGLHLSGGRAADWMRSVSHKRHEAALRAAAGQVANGKDVNVSAIIKSARHVSQRGDLYPDGILMDEDIAPSLVANAYRQLTGRRLDTPNPKVENKKPSIDDDTGPTIGDTEDGGGVKWDYKDKALDFDTMGTVDSKTIGTNKGGIYNTPDGTIWYVKEINSDWAGSEFLTGLFLKMLGAPVPEIRLVHSKGKPIGVASKWVKGSEIATWDKIKKIKVKNPDSFKAFSQSIVYHMWLGNFDVLAPGNLIIQKDNIISIDFGGGLFHRAQGKQKQAKDFSNNFNNISILFKRTRLKSEKKAILDLIDPQDIRQGIKNLYALMDDNVLIEFGKALEGQLGKNQALKIVTTLIERKNSLKKQDIEIVSGTREYNEIIHKGEIKLLAGAGMKEQIQNKKQYQEFHTQKEAQDWIKKQITLQKDFLTVTEKKILNDFQEGDPLTGGFNHWIRVGMPEANVKVPSTKMNVPEVQFSAEKVAQYKPIKAALDKLIARAYGIPIQMRVWRKTAAHHLVLNKTGQINVDTVDPAKLVGQTFETKGWDSTTILREVAEKWSDDLPHRNLVFHYTLPKEHTIIFAGAGFKNNFPSEVEYLMRPGIWEIHHAYLKQSYAARAGTTISDEFGMMLHLHIKPAGKKTESILPDEMLASSQHYHKNTHSNLTAETKLSPDDTKLSKVEETLKVESDPHGNTVAKINKELDDIIEESSGRNKELDAEIKKAKEDLTSELNDAGWIKKGLSAAANCIIGKI